MTGGGSAGGSTGNGSNGRRSEEGGSGGGGNAGGGGSAVHGSGGGSGKGGGGSDTVSTAEKAVMAVSAAVTVALFGFALWHALAGPGAVAPNVAVVDSQPAPSGGVAFTVELRNRGDLGLVSATVEAGCTDPPTEIVFQNVPADGHRTGTVVCPPGTSDPGVSVTTWVQE